jgi:two-component system, NtrC family, response regulator GlrR
MGRGTASARYTPIVDDTRATETDSLRDDVRIDRIDLVVVSGRDSGKAFQATRSRCVIGTSEQADLVLTDPTVSRFHCEIELVAGQAVVRDLGSKNGTLVDGTPVFTAPLGERSALTIGNTIVRFAREPAALQPALSARDRFGALVGHSRPMRSVFALLEHAARTNVAILLRGETGTGKGLAATSIHQESARRDGPCVIVDLAGVSDDRLNRDLFGTDNAFVRARGGTIVLDEIGALDAELQRGVLRMVEGARDVRVIATTHRDLRADVNARQFRADLYFQVAVFEVVLPAVRERADDIPMLVSAIADDIEDASPVIRDPAWIAALLKHPWPGNVRELRNHVERAARLGESHPASMLSLKDARALWVHTFENHYLAELLRLHEGNVTAAARAAGIDRVHLYRLLHRSGLK